MGTEIQSQVQVPADLKRDLFIDFRIVFLLAICVAVLNMLWFSFDYHFPTQDEAEHIMNSIVGKDLLRHFHPWNYHWWQQMLTINCFYPPTVYMVNGFFMLLFGQSRFVEQLSLTFFLCIAIISTYGIVRLSKGSRLAACISASCLAAYPLIAQLGHSFFLDLPEVAMTALSLMALFWWKNSQTPAWKRTVLTAIIIAISCLTKQLVAAFLIPVAFYLLMDYFGLTYPFKKPRWNWLMHISTMGIIIAAIGLPFILINYKPTHEMTNMIMGDFALKKVHLSYLDRLNLYLPLFTKIMSPWLLIIFIGSFLLAKREEHIRLFPVTLSAFGGLGLMLAWPGNAVDPRYLAPALILPAIYTGFLLANFLYSNNLAKQSIAILVSSIALLQFIYSNFVPYPFQLPRLPRVFDNYLAQNNPVPVADWGHNLVIDTIKNVDGAHPVYLNVLTNLGSLHTHAFELLLKEAGNHTITPTTARAFTIFGDKVQFTSQQALQSQWYLWKTGSIGYLFFDQTAENNFNELVNFIRNSGNYKLMAQKTLPDSSQLMLYRRTF